MPVCQKIDASTSPKVTFQGPVMIGSVRIQKRHDVSQGLAPFRELRSQAAKRKPDVDIFPFSVARSFE
jgi:hypothetical protein